MVNMDKTVRLQAWSIQQISRIPEVTDIFGLNREGMEIPLSPESASVVRRLANGKIEIIVDAGQLFDQWFKVLPTQIQSAERS